MCGIAGLLNLAGGPVDAVTLSRMTHSLAHRGPDGVGTVIEDGMALGHRRLSILDHEGGHQPMSTEDGSLWISFNGEIFNCVELRDELAARGYAFRTRSDTEVVLQMYRAYGDECVQRLNGDWAFALWDRQKRRLLLTRDRMGVRPLFYTTHQGVFAFASEVKALFQLPGVRRAIDPQALDQFFTFWTPLPGKTFFRDIDEVPPGYSITVSQGEIRRHRYWSAGALVHPDNGQPEARSSEQLLDLLTDATRIRLRADVSVGAFLSGGLDSTVTAALAARLSPGALRTFSLTFDDPALDETAHQREASARLGTEHVERRCSESDVAEVFPEVIWHTEKPVLRAAPAAIFLLSRTVREQAYKVVVTGEGADEWLGGYDIFKEAKIRQFWSVYPESTRRAQLLRRLYPYMPALQAQPAPYLRAFFDVTPEDCASPLFSHLPRWRLTARLKRFYSPALRDELRGYEALDVLMSDLPEGYGGWDLLSRGGYLETAHLLPGYILSSQGDRMSMAHGVEGRYPFLDHRVVEFAASVPSRLKLKVLNEKYILKRAAAHLVPASIAARKKQPFRAPDGSSFLRAGRTPPEYVSTLLSPARLAEDGLFDPSAVQHLTAKAMSGRPMSVKDDMALVGILSTQLLVERFVRTPHVGN
jgi:asparagine synthase (glutamine-hydrolysing)